MSRTYRRRKTRYNLDRVLCDYTRINGHPQRIVIDPGSRQGRKMLARCFSDAGFGDYAHVPARPGCGLVLVNTWLDSDGQGMA
ncbi:MAG: hypothetical protein LBU11_12760 [Zoogloeaceae bacterium]|nr:hypothetical protein [Zoogloeaceae bacterium]